MEGALWRGSGGGCVSGRERAGRVPGPGFAPSYTPTFGLAAATLLLLQPPWWWHYVTAGSPLLLLSPSLASIDRSPSGLLATPASSCHCCHSHYPCCHYPRYSPVAFIYFTSPVRLLDPKMGQGT